MPSVVISIDEVDKDYLSQLNYALPFAAEAITSYKVDAENLIIEAEIKSEEDRAHVSGKIQELVERYKSRAFGLPTVIHFEQKRDILAHDTWQELLDRRWVTPIGLGHVVLRGPAARLMSLIDAKVQKEFVKKFDAELEVYPPTIRCESLDRCQHFTSFPEHMDFVGHLKQDLGVLNDFSKLCKHDGWSAKLHEGRMAETDLALSPSCCYHCYEAMEGWKIEPPGRCVTAVLACHRYEGANHRSMSRLRSFTMREVIFIGKPQFVINARARAEELIIDWMKDWELDCTFETANDLFFTEDYSVKASFQRQQQAKKELRLRIPQERQAISVFSSNFHALSFGKAFHISVGDRPATTGCLGWGYERWVYAIYSQLGFEVDKWPTIIRDEFENCRL